MGMSRCGIAQVMIRTLAITSYGKEMSIAGEYVLMRMMSREDSASSVKFSR